MPHGIKIYPQMPTLEYYILGFGNNLKIKIINQNMTPEQIEQQILEFPQTAAEGY